MLERENHLSFNATFEKSLCISLWTLWTLCLCGDAYFTWLTAPLRSLMSWPAERNAGGVTYVLLGREPRVRAK